MASRDDWFDPRLTVFVIWGIFVILFICIPSKRLVQRIFVCLGCSCCAYDEEVIPDDNNSGGNEVNYEILSNARKQEIDSLRASHITYRLHPFSMSLEKKHMLRRVSVNGSLSIPENDDAPPQDRQSTVAAQEEGKDSHSDDVETGCVRGMDPPERDDEEKVEEEDVQYTHVSVPQPAHNFDNVDMLKVTQSNKDEDDKKPKKDEKKTKIRLFGGKANKGDEDADNDVKELEPDTTTKELAMEKGESRCHTISCAICLMDYEPSERISWSSNPECTHVFHEDCVVNWLVSLGRTKSKSQRFGQDPTEAQLLNYQLECPCCRQEFISRGQADLPDVCAGRGAEERV